MEMSSAQSSFVEIFKYDDKALAKIAREVGDYFSRDRQRLLHILDVGTGTGRFILPIVEFLEREALIKCKLDCFDVSPEIVNALQEHLFKAKLNPANVRSRRKNAEDGLLDTYEMQTFDLITMTFVLEEIDDLENFLDDVADCMKKNGLIIQAEAIGDFRPLDNKCDAGSLPIFERFWEKYFTERAKYQPWSPDISISDYSLVYEYLRKKNGFKFYKEESFLWEETIKWGELCAWIEHAPLSSLRRGLSPLTREYLARVMANWLEANRIREKSNLTLKWGVKITWMNR
jgi:SAM-dependent methyltransferase